MKHYIIVRRDLRFPKGRKLVHKTGVGSTLGVTAAQITHAAGESFAALAYAYPKTFKQRLRDLNGNPTIAVVLGTPNERGLKRVEQRLLKAGVRHVAIREPDAPWNGQLMTIGVWPGQVQAEKLLRRLKLL